MNESDVSEDEINVLADIERRGFFSSSSEPSDGNVDYDMEWRGTENREGEEFDQFGPSEGIISEERLPQNAERLPAHPGKTFDLPPKQVPLFYLEKFLDEELIQLITKQTNLYAAQFFDNDPKLRPRSRIRKWKDTNEAEIKIFLGLLILQGIIGKPAWELYFSRRRIIGTPFFYETMSESRFGLLRKFLHFADNLSFDPKTCNKKTYKIDPIINNLSEKFKSFYVCEQKIGVDEPPLLWKGNLSWKQFRSTKRARFGMNLFILSESQSGYVQNIILYAGKSAKYGSKYSKEQSTRIVLELTHDLLDKGYRIYLDNFYTSIHLAELLSQKNSDIVGTMSITRAGIPCEIQTKKLEKNEQTVRFKDKLIVLKWKDKKDVLMLSSIHNDQKTVIEKRARRREKPKVAPDYKSDMGGIDFGDGVMMAYAGAHNGLKKLYKRIFIRLIDICCFNAFIIYKKDKGHLDRLHFLIECVEKLVDNNRVRTRPKTSKSSSKRKSLRLVERHFPEKMKTDEGKTKARKCRVCYKKGLRKKSRYWCPDCEVALCIKNCFKIYHTETEF